MTASIEFFPVGNGDMTLIHLATGKTILIDINIRQNADNESEDDYPDVASMLRDRLSRDCENRPYVDAFVLTHPDQDHCGGLRTHFHLGSPTDWKEPEDDEPEKVVIREMWSSPLIFRRTNKEDGALSADAEAWKKEAKRRVELAKEQAASANELGNLIRIMGQDIHEDKMKGIEHLMVKVGDTLNAICGERDPSFSALLLSPKVVSRDEADELAGKNNSSIVMQYSISAKDDSIDSKAATFLTGGDAEIDIWKRIWGRNKETPENLGYHILQAPHHCSLGALSYDKYNDRNGRKGKGEDCEIDKEAYSALSQAENGASIVASSEEPERQTGKDLAKRKYQGIASDVDGDFYCTMTDSKDKPLKFDITDEGPKLSGKKERLAEIPAKVRKGTTDRPYA